MQGTNALANLPRTSVIGYIRLGYEVLQGTNALAYLPWTSMIGNIILGYKGMQGTNALAYLPGMQMLRNIRVARCKRSSLLGWNVSDEAKNIFYILNLKVMMMMMVEWKIIIKISFLFVWMTDWLGLKF